MITKFLLNNKKVSSIKKRNKVCFEFELHYLTTQFALNFTLQNMCERSRGFYILSTVPNFSPYFRSKKR